MKHWKSVRTLRKEISCFHIWHRGSKLTSLTLPNNINITYAYLPNSDRIMRDNRDVILHQSYEEKEMPFNTDGLFGKEASE